MVVSVEGWGMSMAKKRTFGRRCCGFDFLVDLRGVFPPGLDEGFDARRWLDGLVGDKDGIDFRGLAIELITQLERRASARALERHTFALPI